MTAVITSDVRAVDRGGTLQTTLWTPMRGRMAIKVLLPSCGHTKPLVAFLVPGSSTPALASR